MSAVRRSAPGILLTRLRISLACLFAERYWPASSALHARACAREGCSMECGSIVCGRLLTTLAGHDDSDVVEQAHSHQLSNGIFVLRLRVG